MFLERTHIIECNVQLFCILFKLQRLLLDLAACLSLQLLANLQSLFSTQIVYLLPSIYLINQPYIILTHSSLNKGLHKPILTLANSINKGILSAEYSDHKFTAVINSSIHQLCYLLDGNRYASGMNFFAARFT